jgi:hypothetical protein
MRITLEARRARLAVAVIISAAALLTSAIAPAGAVAAPPRDPSRFACPPNSPNPFTDIAGSVHESSIRCEAAYGFINGTTSTTFSPSAPVTRGQVASFIARGVAFARVPLDTTAHGFTDIAGNVHEEAINALANLGVLNGTSPTTFSPDQAVTRAQFASMGARLLNLASPLPPGPDAFTDDDGNVHEANINALAALGILGGVTNDHFNPDGPLARGAAASVLARTQDYAVETGLSFTLGPVDFVLAPLTGAAEVPGPGDASAKGTVELVRTTVHGLLCVTIDFDVALSGPPTEVHVHHGNAGASGPDVLTIPPPASGSGTHNACFPGLDQGTIDAIFGDPAAYYFNVHTAQFPDGAIRGQLSPVASAAASSLLGTEEAPGPGETGGHGGVEIDTLSDGTTVCGFLQYVGAGTPMAAHIHKAAPGVAGPIVVTLPPFDGPFSDGCIGGLAPTLVADIAAHPTDYYVNVHTNDFPDGAVRGQLETLVTLGTLLTGGAEVPGPGDPDGGGDASILLVGDDLLCAVIHVRGTGKPMAAHIHKAASGVAGPIVVTLPTPVFNSSNDCTQIDPALYDDIAASPSAYYVNVHTADLPGGAVRGQLARGNPGQVSVRSTTQHTVTTPAHNSHMRG